jgi:phosphoribosylformylglycinamidine synthase
VTLWEIDIYPRDGFPNRLADAVAASAHDLGLGDRIAVEAAQCYLVQGDFTQAQIEQIAGGLLADGVVERTVIGQVGADCLQQSPNGKPTLIHVLPKPGVTDAVAESALQAIRQHDFSADAVCTMKKYWFGDLDVASQQAITARILANDSIEQVIKGPLQLKQLQLGKEYHFQLQTVPILQVSDHELQQISRERLLSLTLVEMQTIQNHFRELNREPTDAELETIAQTWSEHCSHKTLAGKISYSDENGSRHFNNMLKETIFAATQKIRADLGDKDWCVSVFRDNAGIVHFDENYHVAFKVETHNRPSALEPYGGANTGIGGVIRDTLGTGLGAKPVCNTDVFCFASPTTPVASLPDGVLHPRRIFTGVVSGVRDYGNRMGIPTVNGAIYFDQRYLGNPLVFCGNVGILPHDKSFKKVQPHDLIVSIGGRTGRDGIHGATFSSIELTSESETTSGGAVQIGNAITEKMAMDVLLKARDQNLYSAVTDCGAGGFSSAVGEMGEELGAEVWLEKAPLKYEGLSYTEIWISEAQERMVFAVPEANWPAFHELCRLEDVEATVIGRFVPSGRLTLKYNEHVVADLSMEFIHDGRPPVVRAAVYQPKSEQLQDFSSLDELDLNETLHQLLALPNIASKEWVIRQYDHEVQGGSAIKPLVGANNDGPSDAAVVRPVLSSRRGLVISCGMNPHLGDADPYWMAASGIDEAMRNCVAVGADPRKIALLDNFCWGYTDRPETLGSLVRAAIACYDMSIELQTPFVSGKDSLNNEFRYQDASGNDQLISIPSTLLISALGQVDDVQHCVTMDLKSPGNLLYQVGWTANEFGGSHFGLLWNVAGGLVPKVDVKHAKQLFLRMHQAIHGGTVRSCHDLSEGGLAVAIAEMAFAGGWGAEVDVALVPLNSQTEIAEADRELVALFAESNTRFICEVETEKQAEFESALTDVPYRQIGYVSDHNRVRFLSSWSGEAELLIDADIDELKHSWQKTLKF